MTTLGPVEAQHLGTVIPEPDICHTDQGTSFLATVNGELVRVLIPTEQATKFINTLAKGRAAIEVMRERYEAKEEAFAIHAPAETPEAMALMPITAAALVSPEARALMDQQGVPVGCGGSDRCSCS